MKRKLWYITEDYSPILIRCTVEETQYNGTFFWLDEPVGHGLPKNELYKSFNRAKKIYLALMKAKLEEDLESLNGVFSKKDIEKMKENLPFGTLEDWRRRSIRFIRSTGNKGVCMSLYKKKYYNRDWFNGKSFENGNPQWFYNPVYRRLK